VTIISKTTTRKRGTRRTDTGSIPASTVDLGALLTRFAEPLERELRRAVPTPERSSLYTMLAYHLGWVDADGRPTRGQRGKQLRPTLLLLADEAAGGDPAAAMPAAAAVELLHNFSLIHDDIQDRSAERHGRRVVWSVWGVAQGINAGDAMHAAAALSALRCAELGAPPEVALDVARLLHECCLRLVEGQYLDLQFERRDDVSPADYLAMIDGKTGALLATSIEIGALLGGGAAHREEWRAFGRHLGRAFQIVDDVLGIWGDQRVTGKPAADDVVRGKRTLPFLVAAELLPPEEAGRLRALYALPARDASAVAEAIGLMERSGARRAAHLDAERHVDEALRALDATGARARGGDELRAIARFVVERDR
jgi:geranylgeranyl diphosphate synthase type I